MQFFGAAVLLASALSAAASAPLNATACTTDHRLSAFPIRFIKCNQADLACFKKGLYAYGGQDRDRDVRCTGLWTQGPCDKFHWLVVDKERFFATGYIRTVCVPYSMCPKGYALMAFDGQCYSNKDVAVNCPKVEGFVLRHDVFGEGECVCENRGPMPVRYCDTVAVGDARGPNGDLRLPDPPLVDVQEPSQDETPLKL